MRLRWNANLYKKGAAFIRVIINVDVLARACIIGNNRERDLALYHGRCHFRNVYLVSNVTVSLKWGSLKQSTTQCENMYFADLLCTFGTPLHSKAADIATTNKN